MSEDLMSEHTVEEALQYAEHNNLDVVFPKSNELQIDIDDLAGEGVFVRNFLLLQEVYPNATYITRPSRSALKNRYQSGYKPDAKHITVDLRTTIGDTERIAWQAALGSDPRREAHSLVRLSKGDRPTLFFEVK